jgi:hypothetical protein
MEKYRNQYNILKINDHECFGKTYMVSIMLQIGIENMTGTDPEGLPKKKMCRVHYNSLYLKISR